VSGSYSEAMTAPREECQGRAFVDVDLSDAWFREVDVSRVRMRGVFLVDADLDFAVRDLNALMA
jgi:uncharacterized protein YjbI with pentapeptide repeats